ncbi:hypothetical protein Gorai_001738 [Gossypium raimondii]|uniref:Uncharacterized protein n=1 Tax=Gossypium raimondii TaxID=29730 RepID=A0A7J8PHK9_GOSRA|nr:hypothetical protein [Gossypium raimondii]
MSNISCRSRLAADEFYPFRFGLASRPYSENKRNISSMSIIAGLQLWQSMQILKESYASSKLNRVVLSPAKNAFLSYESFHFSSNVKIPTNMKYQ